MTDRAATVSGCASIQININLPTLGERQPEAQPLLSTKLAAFDSQTGENILSKYNQFAILFSFN